MFMNPAVLGINSDFIDIDNNLPLARKLANSGNNSGNVIFSEALYRVLKNAKKLSYHIAPGDLDGCDAVVIAAANWINPNSDFGFIADKLEKLKLPVIICGIGAQEFKRGKIEKLKPGTLKLLSIAAERSKTISVRGTYSCEVLDGFGFKNVVPTGCPSLLLAGSDGLRINTPNSVLSSDIAIHSTRHLSQASEAQIHSYLYREAMNANCDIVLQSELIDMRLIAGETFEYGELEGTRKIIADTYGSDIENVKKYLASHGKYFFSLKDMLRFFSRKKFSLGTRFHATIASLLAGTPAMLIAHDSRTEELAMQMGIPYILENTILKTDPIDFNSFMHPESQENLMSHFPIYRDNFVQFFNSNGLAMSAGY